MSAAFKTSVVGQLPKAGCGYSLNARLLVSVGLLLGLFFGVTAVVLDYQFRQISFGSIRDRLEVETMALMAATEEKTPGHLVPSTVLLDSRFLSPNSGLYAVIVAPGASVWASQSLLGTELDCVKVLSHIKPGERHFGEEVLSNGTRVLALSIGYMWQFSDGSARPQVFSVAESQEPYYAQLRQFRAQLFGGFTVLSLLLMVALAALLRRVLKPLRRIEQEIESIEAGKLCQLSTEYPRELSGVQSNLNALLRSERQRSERYRDTLGNLAHSLKTPLAVLRNLVSSESLQQVPEARQLDEQLEQMNCIVSYQLKRAAASGGTGLGAPVAVRELIEPLRSSLHKVYFERDVHSEMDIAGDCRFAGDGRDLMEIAGNLLDNAFKYGHRRVRFSAAPWTVQGMRRDGVVLVVEDDGPGIAPDKRQQVLARGMRLDERQSGQGIGLSIVSELAKLYRGTLEIGESSLGGAKITVHLLGA